MRLAELIGTLSLATDAGTAMPEEHGLRAAIAAIEVAKQIGASPREQSDAYYLALLRYTGCTADGHMAAAVFGDEMEFGVETAGMDYGNPREVLPAIMRRARRGKGPIGGLVAMAKTMKQLAAMPAVQRAHCEVAALLARRLGFDDAFCAALAQHSERYNGGGGPTKAKGDAIARAMRIAHVAEDVEIGHRLGEGVDGARARVGKLSGKSLDPSIVGALDLDGVCAALAVPATWTAFLAAEPAPHRVVEESVIDEAIATMGDFADLKCRYTRGHSRRVADLAAQAATLAKLPAGLVRDIRRAGLLHDIGRVAISAGIWDKPAPLTDQEREKVRLHTYVGERVLARSQALAPAGEIASLAHERLDGAGYHRRLPAAACPPAARILAAADVYCALVEVRPHRPAFTRDGAAAELGAMASTGTLCPDATRFVLEAAGHRAPKAERAAGLTDREVEVLRLLARGLTNKEIASELGISTKTAGHHVQHIFEKLEVTTRAAAAMSAMHLGITA